MSAPERIWAWWEYDSDFRGIDRWEDEARTFSDDEYDGAEYIRADTVAEMIRQAVQAEREACAKVAEDWFYDPQEDVVTDRRLAADIRARGEK